MTKRIFVGGLSWSTTDDSLRAAFEQHGDVTEARVIMDRDSGRSRGFGFVTMDNGGDEAIQAMDGQQIDGRAVRVNEAHERSSGGGGG
ncbi:MAG: cold-inducible RNA-binding protein, partial [Myxococcota bacterium]